MTEDEMAEWQHRLNGHQSELTLGDSEEQGSPACCSPSSHKESDTTEQLNNSPFKALLLLLPGTSLKLQPNWAASCEEAPAPILGCHSLSHAMRQDTLCLPSPKAHLNCSSLWNLSSADQQEVTSKPLHRPPSLTTSPPLSSALRTGILIFLPLPWRQTDLSIFFNKSICSTGCRTNHPA